MRVPTQRKVEVGTGVFIGFILLAAGIFLLNAWLLMVAMGIVKGVFGLGDRWAIGFWPAAGVTFALGVLKSILWPTSIST